MAGSLTQVVTAASAATGGTSITPTLAASAVGSQLFLLVSVTATNPTITTPTNWTQVQKTQGAALASALYVFPNNPGGITAIATTIGGTSVQGIASCAFEIAGCPAMLSTPEYSQQFVGTSSSAPIIYTVRQAFDSELWIMGFGYTSAAAPLNTLTSPEWSAAIGFVASTNGAPNATVAAYWTNPQGPSQPFDLHNFTTSAWIAFATRWLSTTSSAITLGRDGGVFVGQGFING